MTDNEHNNSPDINPADNEDELENLTSDEKAAFEKIMSQIGDSNDDLDLETPTSASAGDDSAAAEEASRNGSDTDTAQTSEAAEPSGDDDSITDDQQAALDNIMAEIKGEDDADTDKDEKDASAESSDDANDDSLTDDQQAALDNIMAEIKGDDGADIIKDEKDAPAESSDDADDESLTDDQQAALDNIMAEIKGDDGADVNKDEKDAPVESSDEADDDSLTDDQQAALDNIMTEIKGDDDAEAVDDDKDAPAESPDETDDESLTDDQQAALDNILAEIKGGDDADIVEEDKDTPTESSDTDDASVTEEQQAALENLMSEINDAKEDAAADPASGSEGSPEDAPLAQDSAAVLSAAAAGEPGSDNSGSGLKKELSIDEFNHELSNLLEVSPERSDNDDSGKPVSDKDGEAAKQSGTDSPAADQEYVMLQEVNAGNEIRADDRKTKKKGRGGISISLSRSALVKCTVLATLLLAAVGAYWGFDRWYAKPNSRELAIPAQAPTVATPADPAAEPAPAEPGVASAPEQPPLTAPEDAGTEQSLSPFALLATDLAQARQRLRDKIDEIKELKAYYRKGIIEERQKIEARISKLGSPTYKKAVADSRIELSLQAIQRREIYIAKLDTPLKKLVDLSEKLLYLERRNRMLETLNQGLSGLPIAQLKRDISGAISEQLEKSQRLSIDHVKVPAPTLASIWDDIRQDVRKTGVEKRTGGNGAALDSKIALEMCNGDFGRKYLLTAMTAESAKCLSKWQGKDLYLNNLVQLPPGVAKALSQWQGEWLSLNGIRSISPESARHLSQWPGRRLSLNGLAHLSNQATAHLSKWHGEQLEMVGLKSIGRWENYGTRLYLSEALKRKLKRP